MLLLTPGTLLQERYRVEQLIGQGGFGAVYEARDERLNRRVALKQLLRRGDRLSRQFRREAQLLANLEHAALPDVHDHFSTPDGQFLVMQYVPGDDLGTLLLRRDAPFALEQVQGWASGLLDALHYLHTRQPPIIHRDIKPQNLKLQHDGAIMLLDFGLAKGYAGESPPSTAERSLLAYTKGFAPPEQVEGLGTDERSDLYALGATLYCLLSNSAPLEAQTRLLAVARGRSDPLRPVHELNEDVPEAIGRVLEQAMQLEREHRQQTAQAMRAMLIAAHDASMPARPPSAPLSSFRSEPRLPKAAPPTSQPTLIEAMPSTKPADGRPDRAVDPAVATPSRHRRSRLAVLLGSAALLTLLLALLFVQRGNLVGGGVLAASGVAETALEPTPRPTPEPSAYAADTAEAIDRYIASAEQAYTQGEYDAAIERYSAAIELSGDAATGAMYYGRGLAHQANAKLDGKDTAAELSAAYDDLAEANSIASASGSDEERAWIWYGIGSVTQELYGENNISADTAFRSAIPLFNAAIERDAGNGAVREGLGWTHFELEEWNAALTAFDAAIDIDAENAAAHLGKANTLQATGDSAGACHALADGLAVQPDATNATLENARTALGCQ